MKRTPLLVLAIGLMVILPRISHAQLISGSDHDFSTDNWNSTGEVCAVCHAPHAGNTTVTFLWAHDVTASTFTPYSSTELDAIVGQPEGASKLCLSCHDGTVALDSFGGDTGTSFLSGDDNLGTDMMANHPVSFTYDAALASSDGGLFDPTTTNSGLGGTIAADMLSGASKLECTSCHNPHGTTNSDFLIKGNGGSALCMTCHNK